MPTPWRSSFPYHRVGGLDPSPREGVHAVAAFAAAAADVEAAQPHWMTFPDPSSVAARKAVDGESTRWLVGRLLLDPLPTQLQRDLMSNSPQQSQISPACLRYLKSAFDEESGAFSLNGEASVAWLEPA